MPKLRLTRPVKVVRVDTSSRVDKPFMGLNFWIMFDTEEGKECDLLFDRFVFLNASGNPCTSAESVSIIGFGLRP